MPFAVVAAVALTAAPSARAQVDEESASGAGDEGYAWGSPGGNSVADSGEDPLRIQGYLGAGLGFRPLRNLDFDQAFMSPAYLNLAGVVYLPGRELRHGVGLGISTTLSNDHGTGGVRALQQWAFTPAYYLMVPLRRILPDMEQDLVQIYGHVGIPLVLSSAFGSNGGVNFSVGGELGAGANFKFLAGLGVYFGVQASVYAGSKNTFHPVISADAGLVIDYEVLP